jgi:hypothetical protein
MDDHDDVGHRRQRETFLTIFLTVGGGLVLLAVLVFISLGAFFWVAAAMAAIGLFGLFHYVLWGHAMSRSTAGEREEEQLRAQAEADDWPLPEPRRPRHL